jgi:TolB protein
MPELLFEYSIPTLPYVVMNWSQDGQRLAFDGIGVGGEFDIYVADWNGNHIINITNSPVDELYPTWIPDSSQISYAGYTEGKCRIYSSDPDGTGRVKLLNTVDIYCHGPHNWSPDGKQIIFTSPPNYPGNLYTANPDGTDLFQITDAELESLSPATSPDGSWIVFTRDVKVELGGLNPNLYLIRTDGTDETVLLDDKDSRQFLPAWSPMGDWIAFDMRTYDTNGNAVDDIYLIKSDGTQLINVTNTPDVNESGLAWRMYYTP